MSRSIHTTIKQWSDVARWDRTDRDYKGPPGQPLFDQVVRKHRVKRQVHSERRAAGEERWPTAVESLPIGVEDAGPFVHYPAGPDDLRGVMRRLPPGVLDGLQRIDLQLGAQAQLDRRDCACELAPDPYVGRLGGPFTEGVYQGHIHGQYDPRTTRIFVYGYVYDPSRADPVLEAAIRRFMLEAFVHEVAHHDDQMRRTARGRWLADDKPKAEVHAEAGQRMWVNDCVRPYLRETYGAEIQRILASRSPER